jgi:hypothetical protein
MTALGVLNTVLITGGLVCLTVISFRLTESVVREFSVLRPPEHSRFARQA